MNNYDFFYTFITQNIGDGLITIFTLITLGVLFLYTSSRFLILFMFLSSFALTFFHLKFFEISLLILSNHFVLTALTLNGLIFGVFNSNGKTDERYIKDARNYTASIMIGSICLFFINLKLDSVHSFFLSLDFVSVAFLVFFGFISYLANLKLKIKQTNKC